MITDQEKLAGGVMAVLDGPGARLVYQVTGTGPAVVLIHGFGLDIGGAVLAGPGREREETLVLDLDLGIVAAARRYLDPVGHYNRPDIFRLCVDTSSRPAVIETPLDHLRSPS